MENLPNDVIINNITEFRNIIIQQKNYVDEVQLLILSKDTEIQLKDAEIQLRNTSITNMEQVISSKDAEIQLRDTTVVKLEQVIRSKDTSITNLERVISDKKDKFNSIDNIKKKYLKKELEIYKNENISLKSQNDFFKNLFMMNNMLKSNEYIYNYHQPSLHRDQPSLHNQPSLHQLPLHQQTGESHRSNVKPVENSKLNNENQHKNNMGCVLQQLSQKLKEKNKE